MLNVTPCGSMECSGGKLFQRFYTAIKKNVGKLATICQKRSRGDTPLFDFVLGRLRCGRFSLMCKVSEGVTTKTGLSKMNPGKEESL